jgi:NADPH-dependent 2,4-dienoyl-CoA reductase/sulfur reductase-like enzyme
VRDLRTGTSYDESWDRLVLSPGAAAFVPDVSGAERALTLRTVEDLGRLMQALGQEPRTAVVVGGGSSAPGLEVTIVELADQDLVPLDPELAAVVHDEVRRHGRTLPLGRSLGKVLPDAVALQDGRVLAADLVVLAIGVRPETHLAREAGLPSR